MIDYNVLATGSKGNCVIINKAIAIDMGVPFRALKDAYKDLQLILSTHIHGDHFNRTTITRLAQERPTLRWGIPDYLVGEAAELIPKQSIDVLEHEQHYFYGNYLISPVSLVHDVQNTGYHISLGIERENMFIATDTNSLDGIDAPGYDLYLIEANYSESEIVERIRRKQEAGEYCHEWAVLQNHLSREKAESWLYRNMGVNSQYVFLHEHEEPEVSV